MKYLKPLYELTRNVKSLKKYKIYYLILFMIIFSLIYLFLDDSNFSGVNKYKETIKEEVIKDIAEDKLVETFNLNKKEEEKALEKETDVLPYIDDQNELYKMFKTEKALDKTAEEAKEDVLEKEIVLENIEPTIMQKLYNRLYFSVNTGCLLGYGDIYPKTNLCKLISMMHSLSTIALILA